VALRALTGTPTASGRPSTQSRRSGAAGTSVPGELTALNAADDRVAAAVATALRTRAVPANLEPSVGSAAGDKAAPFVDGCNLSWTDTVQPECSYTSGSPKVVLFGDSHAAQWFPPLEQVARRRHWQLESLTKTTCPPNDLPLFSPYLGREYTECQQWRTSILARVRAERPTLVVLGVARHYGSDYHLSVYDSRGMPAWPVRSARSTRCVTGRSCRTEPLGSLPFRACSGYGRLRCSAVAIATCEYVKPPPASQSCVGILASERDHARSGLSDSCDLRTVDGDVRVARNDEPSVRGSLRYP